MKSFCVQSVDEEEFSRIETEYMRSEWLDEEEDDHVESSLEGQNSVFEGSSSNSCGFGESQVSGVHLSKSAAELWMQNEGDDVSEEYSDSCSESCESDSIVMMSGTW